MEALREVMQELGMFIHREGRYSNPDTVPFIEVDYSRIEEEGYLENFEC